MINIKEIFGGNILFGDEVNGGLDKLPQVLEKEVSLDFCGCMMEYDATGLIIDHFLTNPSVPNSGLLLNIDYDIDFPERYLFDFFFSVTDFFDFDNANSTLEERITYLAAKLNKLHIVINITIYDSFRAEILNRYTYGNS